jgi:hypothetical protein
MVKKGRSWLLLAAGLSALLLGPCSSKAARDASPGSQGVDKPSKIACAKLTRTQCMAARECMLVHTPQLPRRDLYDCRVAEPTCETGFAQQDFLGKTARSLAVNSRQGDAIAIAATVAEPRFQMVPKRRCAIVLVRAAHLRCVPSLLRQNERRIACRSKT